MTDRAAVEVETLLKVVLVLVVIWLVLEIVGEVLNMAFGLFGFLRPILGLLILALIVLWLLDRI
ncbi:MAG TPA: hypothetical protein VKA37_02920 [Halobacteriales archaeon]|nr:hypothetical protein [Halobacteriales archaeon]